MKLSPTFAVAALFALSSLHSSTRNCTDADKARPAIESVPFQTLAMGAQSGCKKPAKMLVTSAQEWRRVWSVHAQGLPRETGALRALPHVDFSRQAVVVLLRGEIKSEAEKAPLIEISQVVRTPSETVIFFTQQKPRGENPKLRTWTPFHFAAIDKPVAVRFADVFAEPCTTCVVGR